MAKKVYHLTFDAAAHPGGIKRDDIPDGHGGCDAAVFVSIIFDDDGGASTAFFTLDGRTNTELAPIERFKAWALWSKVLADTDGLRPQLRAFAAEVFERWRDAVIEKAKANEERRECEN